MKSRLAWTGRNGLPVAIKLKKTFNHCFVPPLEMTSEDTPNGRFYVTPEGNRYMSVTTFLGKFGDNSWVSDWIANVGEERAKEISTAATTRGNKIHAAAEQYLLNNPKFLSYAEDELTLFKRFQPLLNHIDNVVCLEHPLYSDMLKIAGRVDCIAEWKGELAIIDFKTSSKSKTAEDIPNYFLQTTMYALMLQERYGIKTDKLVILVATGNAMVQCIEGNVKDWLPKLAEMVRQK